MYLNNTRMIQTPVEFFHTSNDDPRHDINDNDDDNDYVKRMVRNVRS